MEKLCAALFDLFSYFLFLGISECLTNFTLHCDITSLVMFFYILTLKIISIILLFLSSVCAEVVSLKITLKPNSSFYFSSALSKVIKYIII